MEFAVESWDPDYGTSGDIAGLDPSVDSVEPFAECDALNWGPISPNPTSHPSSVAFVDGVRRIDARIWVTDGDQVIGGSCATVAAGVVVCRPGKAEITRAEVGRGVFAPPTRAAGPIVTSKGTYDYFPVKSGSPEDIYLGIHEQMTKLETSIIPDVGPDSLIVFDGPLRGRTGERAIGLIKTQHVQYLEDDLQSTVRKLGPGQRTPLFLIGAGGFTRWSWYTRLPCPMTHAWAGIIRCEAPGSGTVNDATHFADAVTATLPRFASEPHKESRAPQNLYPIKGLEDALRRRLGDQRLLQRALRQTSAA